MRYGPMRCRKCQQPVAVITYGIFRRVLVDQEAVEVIADPDGEQYVRIDGSKIQGKEVRIGIMEMVAEWAYRPHRCGVKK